MKIFATVLNIVMLLTITILTFADGLPKSGDLLLLALFFATPIVNLLNNYYSSNNSANSENYVSLVLKRKAMEEQAKIHSLKDKIK